MCRDKLFKAVSLITRYKCSAWRVPLGCARTAMSDSFADMLGKYLSPAIGIGLLIATGVIIALFALFVLHTLTFWISGDPEVAFHRARTATSVTSSVWNSVRTLWNGGKKVAFYWVPSWNHWAKHFMEPAIYIGLDVVSQIFTHHHYYGIIRDVDNAEAGGVPFRGGSPTLPRRPALLPRVC